MSLIRKNGMKPAVWTALFLISTLTCSVAAAREIYQWTDQDGVPHFSDLPPQNYESQSIMIPELSDPIAAPVSEAPLAQPESEPAIGSICDQHQDRLDKLRASRNLRVIGDDGEARPLTDIEYRNLTRESEDHLAKNCD